MNMIRRHWSPEDADEWGKEDWIAIVLSVISYILLTVGSALSFLLLPSGFITLGIGIVFTVFMYWVVDPKLRTISSEYEKKQKDYLRQLEYIQKWEATK
jgi:multisubunit Na+/H+ antiporter MnhB subunit